MVFFQVAPQFPDKPSRNGAQPLVRFQGLATVLTLVTDTLVTVDLLEDKGIALAQRKP